MAVVAKTLSEPEVLETSLATSYAHANKTKFFPTMLKNVVVSTVMFTLVLSSFTWVLPITTVSLWLEPWPRPHPVYKADYSLDTKGQVYRVPDPVDVLDPVDSKHSRVSGC